LTKIEVDKLFGRLHYGCSFVQKNYARSLRDSDFVAKELFARLKHRQGFVRGACRRGRWMRAGIEAQSLNNQ